MVLTNKNKHWAWEWGLGYNRKWLLPTEGHKGQSFQYTVPNTYSKVSIIRTGLSRLLEFEKKIVCTGHLIETFSKYPDQVV